MKKDRQITGRGVSAKIKSEDGSSLSIFKLNAQHEQLIHRYMGIVECSLDGKYIKFNDEFCQMLGYERDELLRLGIKDVTHEDDYHIDIKLHGQLIAGEIPHYKIEKRFVRKDGRVVWADATRSVVRNAQGKALYTVGFVLHITEQHNAEDALLAARTRAERIAHRLARLQQITAVLTGTATTQQLAKTILEHGTQAARAAAGILVEVLGNGLEIRTIAALGYPSAAVRTDPVPLSIPTPLSDCIRNKKAVWIGSHEEFAVQYPELAQLRGSFGNEATVALPLIVGEQVLGGLAFSFVETQTFDAEECEFFLAVAQQCAQALERARSDDALRESERKFSLIYDKLPFAATLSNPKDGVLLDVNEAFEKIFGYEREEVIGKTSLELGINPDAESRRRILADLQERGSVRGLELELVTKSRGARTFLVNLDLVEIRGETHILQTAQDITESKRVEDELRARMEELEVLFQVAPIGIFIAYDPACTRIVGNPEGYRIIGLPQFSNVSKSAPFGERPSYRVFCNDEEMANEDLPMQAAARLGREVREEAMELRFEDGSHKYLYAYARPLFGEEGSVRGSVAAMLDITARTQAEDALYRLTLELERRVEERTRELQSANQALLENRRRLQILSQRLVKVQEEERRSLARELHDSVGQNLIALNLNLTIIQTELHKGYTEQLGTRLTDSIKLMTEVISLVRDVMSNLRPTTLDDHGLEVAIQTYINQYQSRYGIEVQFEKPHSPLPRLESSLEMTLLRIGQEALMNIARHAQVNQAHLSLRSEENLVRLTVEDFGIGMESAQKKNPGSQGLTIMRERAEALGGTFSLTSVPGQGTKVETVIPFSSIPEENHHD